MGTEICGLVLWVGFGHRTGLGNTFGFFGFLGGKNVEGLSIVKGSKYPQYKVF